MRSALLASLALFSVGASLLSCGGSEREGVSQPGGERTLTISPFPVVAPSMKWGPDTIQSLGATLENYEHEYFCAQTVVVRTYPNPACHEGMTDCGTTYERAERVVHKTCAAVGTAFRVHNVRQIAYGAVDGRGNSQHDPISGTCTNGLVLGRGTAHAFAIDFDTPAACAAFQSSYATSAATFDVDFTTVAPDRIRFVAATKTP